MVSSFATEITVEDPMFADAMSSSIAIKNPIVMSRLRFFGSHTTNTISPITPEAGAEFFPPVPTVEDETRLSLSSISRLGKAMVNRLLGVQLQDVLCSFDL
jgi:hypothetical protein